MSSVGSQVSVTGAITGQRLPSIERLFRGRITAASLGAIQTLYTAPSDVGRSGASDQTTLLTSIWIANKDSAARTISLYIVESGGSADDDRLVLPAIEIAAHTVYHINQCEELIDNGGTIQAFASVANVVLVRLTGKVFR